MKTARALLAICCGLLAEGRAGNSAVVFEITSPYHHIRVSDQDGIRVLSFDGSMETRMSLRDPLRGHFEYTEYFHMPWLWNAQLTNVLMIGLGGGSAQRAYAHYYPHVTVTTAEIDPAVVEVAKQFFRFEQTTSQRVDVSDGRVFLRRSEMKYGVILVDAYVANRYGSFIPYHLATKEFFELAASHLTTNGVIGYNVIGNLRGWRADLLGAIYKTMKSAFPQVYLFPAKESQNVVIIGTRSAD
jgi:spermidine synthase